MVDSQSNLFVEARAENPAAELLRIVKGVVGASAGLVPLHEPEFRGNEREYLLDCINSTFVSSVGKYVDRFEEMLAAFTGARYAVSVVNGTAALQVALHLAGVQAGDEVLVPALSFVATANAASHCGAVPHFVDVDPRTLGLSPTALRQHLASVARLTPEGAVNRRTGRRIAAIVPMHTFGHPADMEPLLELAEEYRLPVVEDAAESLGSTHKGRHAGTFGVLAALSFNGNKVITTGGGGAILTNDPYLAKRAKHVTTTAKLPHRWAFEHDEVAWNYRLPNLNAAVGCAQLEQMPDKLARKRALAERYRNAFAGRTDMAFVTEPEGSRSNYWLNAVRLRSPDPEQRDAALAQLNDAGYQSRPAWRLLNQLPMYATCPRAPLEVSEALEASLINLPSSPSLADGAN